MLTRRQLLLYAPLPLLAGPAPAPADRAARWRADMKFLVDGLTAKGNTVDPLRGISSRGQKDCDKLYPRLREEASALAERAPSISDAEVVLGLMRLIAGANVSHNYVEMPNGMGFTQRLPLALGWYPDGLGVVGAPEQWRQAIGKYVGRIGNRPVDELLKAVRLFVAAENDVWLRQSAAGYLRLRPVLEHLRLVEPDGTVPVTLQEPGREPITLAIPLTEQQPASLRVREALGITPPLYASGPEQAKYWYRYVPDSQTLFMQYNHCRDDQKQSFADFTRTLLSDVQPRPLQRVVVDLRWNGGGDSRVIRPLKQALAGPLAGKPLYVFIGPETFSSALMNAMELKREHKAVLVGEATGGTPKGYGEVKRLVLPHSRVAVRYTSKFFAVPKEFDVPSLAPDLPAPILFKDVLAGRDPALAAALAASS